MRKSIKINYNLIIVYGLTIFFLVIILPLLSIKLFPSLIHEEVHPNKVVVPKTVDLYLTESSKTITIDFEDYVKGVVASEMPESFDVEALKAQAVASRTYALGKIKSGDKLCDSTHCQVYRSNNISQKVIKAVNATRGQLVYYKNKLASHTLYFSSSGGPTENSEDVFGSPYGYLKSVSSPYEESATHRKEKVIYTLSQFSAAMKSTNPTVAFGKITLNNTKILSRTKGGRVKNMKIGNAVLSGAQVRTALSLHSARFSINISKGKIIFLSSGSGHGVGMSQYGADGYARKGYSYKKILRHYYHNTKVY